MPPINDTLINALIAQESGGDDIAVGDLHLVDHAYGCLQIRLPVCQDVNRVFGLALQPQQMLGDRQLSIDTFTRYMQIYATERLLGHIPTQEDCARIWNGGPAGWKEPATLGYWQSVQKHMVELQDNSQQHL
jgi:hypothetical protein